jgi:hypothetical protein
MEHSPSREANSRSASQEIPRLLWKPKFHYRVHKGPSHVKTSITKAPISFVMSVSLSICPHVTISIELGMVEI